MPSRTQPSSFTAGRAVNINGTSYAKGATVSASVLQACRKASVLLSKRYVIPNTLPYQLKSTSTSRQGPLRLYPAEMSEIVAVVAPTGVSGVRGNASVTVSWTAPAGFVEPLEGYSIQAYAGASLISITQVAVGTSGVVTGLTNGTAYTFKVAAVSEGAGVGTYSSASSAVTPSTVPGAPTIGTATPGHLQASVAFTAPGSNGGATITSYTVTALDVTNGTRGGQTSSGASSPIVVTGLTTGDVYTFTVTATNVAGTGAASAASNSATIT